MSTKKLFFLLLFFQIGMICFGEPIVLERGEPDDSDKPKKEIPITCEKISNTIVFEFTEDIGDIMVSIVNVESGNCIIKTILSANTSDIVVQPGQEGLYIITITTIDTEYIGEFYIY